MKRYNINDRVNPGDSLMTYGKLCAKTHDDRHVNPEFTYIEKGKGIFCVDGVDYFFESGDVFLVFRGESHYMKEYEFSAIENEFKNKSEGYDSAIRFHLMTVLLLVFRAFGLRHGTETSNNTKDILKAMDYIAGHYTEKITLSDIADEAHLSPSYFGYILYGDRFDDFQGPWYETIPADQIKYKHDWESAGSKYSWNVISTIIHGKYKAVDGNTLIIEFGESESGHKPGDRLLTYNDRSEVYVYDEAKKRCVSEQRTT